MILSILFVFIGSLIFTFMLICGNKDILTAVIAAIGLLLALLSTARFALELYAKNRNTNTNKDERISKTEQNKNE